MSIFEQKIDGDSSPSSGKFRKDLSEETTDDPQSVASDESSSSKRASVTMESTEKKAIQKGSTGLGFTITKYITPKTSPRVSRGNSRTQSPSRSTKKTVKNTPVTTSRNRVRKTMSGMKMTNQAAFRKLNAPSPNGKSTPKNLLPQTDSGLEDEISAILSGARRTVSTAKTAQSNEASGTNVIKADKPKSRRAISNVDDMKTKNLKKKMYFCKHCTFKTRWPESLRRHRERHTNGKFELEQETKKKALEKKTALFAAANVEVKTEMSSSPKESRKRKTLIEKKRAVAILGGPTPMKKSGDVDISPGGKKKSVMKRRKHDNPLVTKPYKCLHCPGFRSAYKRALKQHEKRFHKKEYLEKMLTSQRRNKEPTTPPRSSNSTKDNDNMSTVSKKSEKKESPSKKDNKSTEMTISNKRNLEEKKESPLKKDKKDNDNMSTVSKKSEKKVSPSKKDNDNMSTVSKKSEKKVSPSKKDNKSIDTTISNKKVLEEKKVSQSKKDNKSIDTTISNKKVLEEKKESPSKKDNKSIDTTISNKKVLEEKKDSLQTSNNKVISPKKVPSPKKRSPTIVIKTSQIKKVSDKKFTQPEGDVEMKESTVTEGKETGNVLESEQTSATLQVPLPGSLPSVPISTSAQAQQPATRIKYEETMSMPSIPIDNTIPSPSPRRDNDADSMSNMLTTNSTNYNIQHQLLRVQAELEKERTEARKLQLIVDQQNDKLKKIQEAIILQHQRSGQSVIEKLQNGTSSTECLELMRNSQETLKILQSLL